MSELKFHGVGYAGPGIGRAFTAQIEENGHVIELGSFDSAEEAARQYDTYAKLLHGTDAILNYEHVDVVDVRREREARALVAVCTLPIPNVPYVLLLTVLGAPLYRYPGSFGQSVPSCIDTSSSLSRAVPLPSVHETCPADSTG